MLKEKFMQMLEGKKDLSDSQREAKMNAVKDLKGAASEIIGEKLGSLKKPAAVVAEVSVSKADGDKEAMDEALDEEMEASPQEQSFDEDMENFEGLDIDSINRQIEKLMQLKSQMESKES